MKTSLLAALFASSLLLGCEPPRPAAPPIGYLSISTPRRSFDTLKVASTELVGPDVQLYKLEDGFRGMAKGQPIDMAIVEKGRIKGSRGGLPIDLHVNHHGEVIVARGLYGGRLVQIRFSKHGVGECVTREPTPQEPGDEGEGAHDPCNASFADLISKMIEQLGEDHTSVFLAAAYFR